MDKIETVGIRAFGDSVSSFIRKVGLGVRIFISDRGRVVAELRQPTLVEDILGNPVMSLWKNEGRLRVGHGKLTKFSRGEPLLKDKKVSVLLDEMRGDK